MWNTSCFVAIGRQTLNPISGKVLLDTPAIYESINSWNVTQGLFLDRLSVVYNNCTLAQKFVAVVIDSQKLNLGAYECYWG